MIMSAGDASMRKYKPKNNIFPTEDTTEEIQLCLNCKKEKCTGTKRCLMNQAKRKQDQQLIGESYD